MSSPSTQLRNLASLKTLKSSINALQLSRGDFIYNTGDTISPSQQETIKAEFCKFLKVKKAELSADKKNIELSMLKKRYDKEHRGATAERLDDKELMDYYFPDDCTQLYKKMKLVSSSGKRTIYDVLFNSKKREAINLILNFNTIKLFKKDAKLFNCEKIYNKVLQDFQNAPKLPRRRSIRRSGSMLSKQTTPNASEMDMRRNELMGSYRVRSRSSKNPIDASKLKHTTLGKKRKKKSRSKTKRKSTVI